MSTTLLRIIAAVVILVVVSLELVSCGWVKDRCGYPKNFIILKLDKKSKRVFIQSTVEEITDLVYAELLIREIDSYMQTCRSDWSNEYAVSFFTDRKYAGYHDDESLQPFILDGTWEKSYLAEFDKFVSTLVRFPMDPKRTQVDKVEL